jgi:hypothetical protein
MGQKPMVEVFYPFAIFVKRFKTELFYSCSKWIVHNHWKMEPKLPNIHIERKDLTTFCLLVIEGNENEKEAQIVYYMNYEGFSPSSHCIKMGNWRKGEHRQKREKEKGLVWRWFIERVARISEAEGGRGETKAVWAVWLGEWDGLMLDWTEGDETFVEGGKVVHKPIILFIFDLIFWPILSILSLVNSYFIALKLMKIEENTSKIKIKSQAITKKKRFGKKRFGVLVYRTSGSNVKEGDWGGNQSPVLLVGVEWAGLVLLDRWLMRRLELEGEGEVVHKPISPLTSLHSSKHIKLVNEKESRKIGEI